MDWWYKPKKPRKAKDGIRARSQSGRIGKTWWSRKLIRVLESFGWSNRLERGRRYARMGQVMNLKITKGHVEAYVQGTMKRPYHVTIDFKPLPDEDWNKAIDAMRSKAIFSAKLLSGEMPENIEEAFSKHNLFPSKHEIRSSCTCPDVANPCKHVAAVFYILAEEFDRDPFLMFLLRGKSKEEVLSAVGSREEKTESAKVEEEAKEEKVSYENYWKMRSNINFLEIPVKEPALNAALIKRLGEPKFWREPVDFIKVMETVYKIVSERAIEEAIKQKEIPQQKNDS